MITEELIKGTFIRREIAKDMVGIKKEQVEIVAEKNAAYNGRYSELLHKVQSTQYVNHGSGLQQTFSVNVPLTLRFLDMKKYGNWRVYIRIIWGYLYNNSYLELKYGYGSKIKEEVSKMIKNPF